MGLNRHRDRWICKVSDDLRSASSKHPKGQTLPSAGRDEQLHQMSISASSHFGAVLGTGAGQLNLGGSKSFPIP
jgi:hypothetical protein